MPRTHRVSKERPKDYKGKHAEDNPRASTLYGAKRVHMQKADTLTRLTDRPRS